MLSIGIYDAGTWATEPSTADRTKNVLSDCPAENRAEQLQRIGNHRADSFLLRRAITKQQILHFKGEGKPTNEVDELSPLLKPPIKWQGMPSIGTVKILAILIEFNDFTHKISKNEVHDKLFGNGDQQEMPYESLSGYYSRASYGKLNLHNGTTLDWYKTTYDRSAVPQTDAGRENLIKEVLNFYSAQQHDFSQYDNDGDDVIDYFIVIWTGIPQDVGCFWWGYLHRTFSDQTYKIGGKSLGKYSWQWEIYDPKERSFDPRTVIHETGHALGIPDLYQYDCDLDHPDCTRGPKGGVGKLDIMDGVKGDHNCFSKWILEWIDPKVLIKGDQRIVLDATGESPDCLLIWPDFPKTPYGEFFLVQNRHRIGNDMNNKEMPGDGLVIWHVDATLTEDKTDFKNDNSYSKHKLLRLMEADGKENIEKGNGIADQGDYYLAGNQFGSMTVPSSKLYDGTDSGVEISDISRPGKRMSAIFQLQ